ncbi:peptidase inhibitor family I36 protein [Streptomyces monticola]|uniref:Peptidase inhibitor family I36 protein n=1 Tax=Streptomyces monticola TaxID=2666263 RepID=A0ABW2JTB3_9ACTN
MRKAQLALVGLGVAALTGSGAVAAQATPTAAPARAAVVDSNVDAQVRNCNSVNRNTGYVHAWTKPKCQGYHGRKRGNDSNYSSSIDDKATSVVNSGWKHQNDTVKFYTKTKYRGDRFCLNRGDQISTLKKFNDRISSHRWVNGC